MALTYCNILHAWLKLLRIFDLDNNGYVSKKEFKWMTSNKKIDNKKVDALFEVWFLHVFICNPPLWLSFSADGSWRRRQAWLRGVHNLDLQPERQETSGCFFIDAKKKTVQAQKQTNQVEKNEHELLAVPDHDHDDHHHHLPGCHDGQFEIKDWFF